MNVEVEYFFNCNTESILPFNYSHLIYDMFSNGSFSTFTVNIQLIHTKANHFNLDSVCKWLSQLSYSEVCLSGQKSFYKQTLLALDF